MLKSKLNQEKNQRISLTKDKWPEPVDKHLNVADGIQASRLLWSGLLMHHGHWEAWHLICIPSNDTDDDNTDRG